MVVVNIQLIKSVLSKVGNIIFFRPPFYLAPYSPIHVDKITHFVLSELLILYPFIVIWVIIMLIWYEMSRFEISHISWHSHGICAIYSYHNFKILIWNEWMINYPDPIWNEWMFWCSYLTNIIVHIQGHHQSPQHHHQKKKCNLKQLMLFHS